MIVVEGQQSGETGGDSIVKDVGKLEANVENIKEEIAEVVEETTEQIEAVETKIEQVEQRLEWNSETQTAIWNRLDSQDSKIQEIAQATGLILEMMKEDATNDADDTSETATAESAETVVNDLPPIVEPTNEPAATATTPQKRGILSILIYGR